jgi:hypothetical protein
MSGVDAVESLHHVSRSIWEFRRTARQTMTPGAMRPNRSEGCGRGEAIPVDMTESLWKRPKLDTFISFPRAFIAILLGVLIAIVATVASLGETVAPQNPAVGDGTLVPAPGSPISTGFAHR